ncbi:MAG: OmpA family protein [Alphaproteobacteria bacterium]|nr:OmpA family protein [Alphaproteobacteria bacterium]
MTRWIIFAGLTALIVTGYFATFYAHGKSFWRSVQTVPAELQKQAEDTIAKTGAQRWARVQVDGQVAYLTGQAPTEADRDDLKLAVRQAAGRGGSWWGGITQVRDSMSLAPLRKPYFWQARRGENGRVSLMGYVPGQRYYREIKTAAKNLFPTGVDDQLEIAGGHPTGPWAETAIDGLRQLTKLISGEVRFENQTLTIKGEARDSAAQAATYAWAKAIPRPYQGGADVSLADAVALPDVTEDTPQVAEPIVAAPVQRLAAADCQKIINKVMAANTVSFDHTKASIKSGTKRLDKIAQLGVDCGTVQFRVTGHTDGSSLEGAIEYLSQDRALAVSKYLQDNGISRDRIKTDGAGSSSPVGDVDTPEGQARNRRAEVSIVP